MRGLLHFQKFHIDQNDLKNKTQLSDFYSGIFPSLPRSSRFSTHPSYLRTDMMIISGYPACLRHDLFPSHFAQRLFFPESLLSKFLWFFFEIFHKINRFFFQKNRTALQAPQTSHQLLRTDHPLAAKISSLKNCDAETFSTALCRRAFRQPLKKKKRVWGCGVGVTWVNERDGEATFWPTCRAPSPSFFLA